MAENKTAELLSDFKRGDIRALSKMISIVENEMPGWETLLESLDHSRKPISIGITGPPGAGKSTLISALLSVMGSDLRIAVLAVDPSSPFTHGSLLGDRLRMSEHFNSENVFIRSVATRGALGGLNNRIVEILSVLKAAKFDYIILETVGVGQSEVEVASMADTTVLVLVPESGDEVQTMKSGIMEIADIIVVNKSDRAGASKMLSSIKNMLHQKKEGSPQVPVLQTVANEKSGIEELLENIKAHISRRSGEDLLKLLHQQANRILLNKCLSRIDQDKLQKVLSEEYEKSGFNIFRTLKKMMSD